MSVKRLPTGLLSREFSPPHNFQMYRVEESGWNELSEKRLLACDGHKDRACMDSPLFRARLERV